MRIAQIAPLLLPIPPKRYGGTERVVSTLTDALVDRGHEVTLFASGDSRTKGRLSPIVPVSLKNDPSMADPIPYTFIELERMLDRSRDFDVIHNHQDYLAFPFARRTQTSMLTTLHTRLDIPDLIAIFREYSELPIVSISNAQREPLPWAHWVATVHNGIDLAPYPFTPRHGT